MKEHISVYSKEAIKARMLQNAAKIWGLKNTSSIDPFVRLLIEAFSAELFRANNEVHAMNTRVLERLAKLLTPSMYTYSQPAHAIGTTMPLEPTELLSSSTEFYIQKQFSSSLKASSDIQINIPFTPVDHVTLTKMNIDVLFIGHTCYAFDSNFNKIPIAKISDSWSHNKIMMGIDVSEYDKDILPDKLSVYCSNPTFQHIDFVFKLLPFVGVKNRNIELKVNSGLTYSEGSEISGFEEIFKEYAIQSKIEENIKNIYKDKFIEISGLKQARIDKVLPENLKAFSANNEIKNQLSDKSYIWLEIEFPPQYNMEILENFAFVLNAFPIYNRAWRSNESSLDIMGNTIPLATEIGEHFLYVEDVVDEYGNQYAQIPFLESGALKRGLYTVRTGGMERFTERNALEMISNVLELTRDEVSAFGILERDKVSKALTNMTQQMKILEQKVSVASRNILHQVNYVIVDLITDTKNIKADYWITHCELANNIRIGSKLMMQKRSQSSFFRDLTLITETIGGNEEQKGTNAIQAYKYALTTRDKLISIEDIKSYCRLALKNEITSLEVRRGTIISAKPKEGFIRTIEIEIIPHDYEYLGQKYWDRFALTLKHQIMVRAIDGIEYIVKIKSIENE